MRARCGRTTATASLPGSFHRQKRDANAAAGMQTQLDSSAIGLAGDGRTAGDGLIVAGSTGAARQTDDAFDEPPPPSVAETPRCTALGLPTGNVPRE